MAWGRLGSFLNDLAGNLQSHPGEEQPHQWGIDSSLLLQLVGASLFLKIFSRGNSPIFSWFFDSPSTFFRSERFDPQKISRHQPRAKKNPALADGIQEKESVPNLEARLRVIHRRGSASRDGSGVLIRAVAAAAGLGINRRI